MGNQATNQPAEIQQSERPPSLVAWCQVPPVSAARGQSPENAAPGVDWKNENQCFENIPHVSPVLDHENNGYNNNTQKTQNIWKETKM